ncbi:MAG: hypothetical protein A2186_03565 [Candidatus Levybacteria bacterium RIFOXYA1_FULL_41_10]|nr:MAG: hypothetical protein UU45_C0010G0020 [Candidatus Levybacteria bacterium GW2011_GWA2_41_15]OGH50950.1 MAG: hypothetical protein A3J18_02230 [Candidatus Levybacteria bacterium RIFCSPLOWO2_02_FULL_40_18]OGH53632.1 MAG: hypothetical protein A3H20_00985 [Candidatus Levybacteria bacterium RIFCSPLOWO2_12_FULL_41_12]OGH54381.1 MAG: hypothetical protein A2596_01515 [Candidatus Levybacteria bacterium RIFOXYD1_FULL_40_21]OGH57512.1 MAG: hypothetical protein A2186_03565 [Candidatus Levybacteria bac
MSPELTRVKRDRPRRLGDIEPSVVSSETISIPDVTGTHISPWGPIAIDLSRIDPHAGVQSVALSIPSMWLRDRQVLLSPKGRGGTKLSEASHLIVQLHEPIRETKEWKREVIVVEKTSAHFVRDRWGMLTDRLVRYPEKKIARWKRRT